MQDAGATQWTHPSVILVATDLSDLDRLMPFAMDQAAESGARLILLHVLGSVSRIAFDPVGLPCQDPAAAIDSATKTMEPWRVKARKRDISCDLVVREGHAAQQIAAAVRQFHVGRILLGTRSRSKMSKLFLGSVAEQVLRSVNLPVMTVGPEAHPLESMEGGRRVVLYATTLRETSRPSAALACQIAADQDARLVLLHVLPSLGGPNETEIPEEIDAAAARELDRVATAARAECPGDCGCIETRIAHGNPSIEILATAEELNACLVVLGATQRSALKNLTRDRTVYRVLAHAHCPVLTLREAAVGAPAGDETNAVL